MKANVQVSRVYYGSDIIEVEGTDEADIIEKALGEGIDGASLSLSPDEFGDEAEIVEILDD